MILVPPQIVGVAQVINKKNEEGPFTANDENIFERYLTFCGIGITNALLFQSSVIMYKRSDVSGRNSYIYFMGNGGEAEGHEGMWPLFRGKVVLL